MARKYSYDWPRPSLTVDLAVFSVAGTAARWRLQVLLIERGGEPFAGRWALPGGFVRDGEDLPDAARRELQEETGLDDVYLEQVATVGTPGRDPRGHVVTVVNVALVAADRHPLLASGDARAARWFDVAALPPLAFDHDELLKAALDHLRRRLGVSPLCFEMLPEEFTLGELQGLCEAVLGRELDRRNFRRRLRELDFLKPVAKRRREGRHRPAQLFRLDRDRFRAFVGRPRGGPF
jgi:ADP-ribose pyrophosphatase YjhB (NUDIX family)